MRRSITALLATVIVAIASVLCAVLGFQVWDAATDLQQSMAGERLVAADRILYENLQQVRKRRI